MCVLRGLHLHTPHQHVCMLFALICVNFCSELPWIVEQRSVIWWFDALFLSPLIAIYDFVNRFRQTHVNQMFAMMLADVAFLSLNSNQSKHHSLVCLFLLDWLRFIFISACNTRCACDDDCVFLLVSNATNYTIFFNVDVDDAEDHKKRDWVIVIGNLHLIRQIVAKSVTLTGRICVVCGKYAVQCLCFIRATTCRCDFLWLIHFTILSEPWNSSLNRSNQSTLINPSIWQIISEFLPISQHVLKSSQFNFLFFSSFLTLNLFGWVRQPYVYAILLFSMAPPKEKPSKKWCLKFQKDNLDN